MSRSTIALFVPFLIGVIFLAGALVTFGMDAAFVTRAVHTEGQYIGSVSRTGGAHGGQFLYPQFRFITKTGGSVLLTSTTGSTNQPYADDEKVSILYDPSHPEDARLESIWLWITPLFLTPFGLLFTLIPITVFVCLRKRR